jgi:hypothetical protein
LERDVKGQTVWLNPPFGKLSSFVSHFEKCRLADPYSTLGLIVVPDLCSLDSMESAALRPILKKYQLVHTYPKGTFLFHSEGEKQNEALGPTPWDVHIYLADNSVERRHSESASCSLMHASQPVYTKHVYNKHGTRLHHTDEKLNNREWKEKYGRHVKPHQPNFSYIHTASLTSQQAEHDLFVLPGDLVITTSPDQKDQPVNLPLNMLVDCGASECFISRALVAKHGIPTEKLQHAMKVALADSSSTRSTHSVTLQFRLGRCPDVVQSQKFVVTDLSESNQCILGMPWFKQYSPDINWAENYIRLPSSAIVHGVSTKRHINLNIIHASAFAKLLRKNPETQFHVAYISQVDAETAHLAGVQGYDESRATADELASIVTELGEEYDVKVRDMLADYRFDHSTVITTSI